MSLSVIFIEILDDALNSILVTAIIGLYLYLFSPQTKLNAQIEILQPGEIRNVFLIFL